MSHEHLEQVQLYSSLRESYWSTDAFVKALQQVKTCSNVCLHHIVPFCSVICYFALCFYFYDLARSGDSVCALSQSANFLATVDKESLNVKRKQAFSIRISLFMAKSLLRREIKTSLLSAKQPKSIRNAEVLFV